MTMKSRAKIKSCHQSIAQMPETTELQLCLCLHLTKFPARLYLGWKNIFRNLDKYVLHFGEKDFALWKNAFWNSAQLLLQLCLCLHLTKFLAWPNLGSKSCKHSRNQFHFAFSPVLNIKKALDLYFCAHISMPTYIFFFTIPHALRPNNWLTKLHFFASWAKTLKQLFGRIWKLPEMWIYCSWWKIRHCSQILKRKVQKTKRLTGFRPFVSIFLCLLYLRSNEPTLCCHERLLKGSRWKDHIFSLLKIINWQYFCWNCLK